MNVKFTISIGYVPSREEILDVEGWEDLTDGEKNDYWIDWFNNYIQGGWEDIPND